MSHATLLFVGLMLLVLAASVALAVWRLQRHAAERAAAERRIGAALEELHRLTAELRARQAGAPALGVRRGGEAARPASGRNGDGT